MSFHASVSASRPRVRAPARTVTVPRPGGGVRVMTELSRGDAREYAVAVGGVAARVEAALGDRVVANRVTSGPWGRRLEPFSTAHVRWRGALDRELAAGDVRAVLRSDVAACYASIAPATAVQALLDLGASPAHAHTIGALLERWGDEGVPGLPVGPAPSAVVANAVLHRVDEAFRSAGVAHLRWVDDVVAFAPDRARARRAFDAYRRALDTLGLRPNPDKTRLVQERTEAIAVARGRGSTTALGAVR